MKKEGLEFYLLGGDLKVFVECRFFFWLWIFLNFESKDEKSIDNISLFIF